MASPTASVGDRYELVIVGSGAAGVCAAIDAAEAGLSVLVLEAAAERGGAAAISGGGTCIVDSPLQREKGIQDSVDLAFDDWMKWGGEQADAEWARFYIERSAEDLFMWARERGVEWQMIRQQEGNSVPRWHQPKGGGAGFMATMFQALEGLPVELRCSSPVTRIVMEDGRAVGVEVESAGRRQEIRAPAVLVATGGFAGSPEMVRRYGPQVGAAGKLLCGGALVSTGSGHQLLEAVGAQFVAMEQVWTYPYAMFDYLEPAGTRGVAVRGVENDIWVNANGMRFHNETKRGGATGTPPLLAQPGSTCWSIFDSRQSSLVTLADPRFRATGDSSEAEQIKAFLDGSPHFHGADSIPRLAQLAGLPADVLTATIEEFNGWIRQGLDRDPRFGRPLSKFEPLEHPPFYALQYFPLARKCFGGVRTDLSCRVINQDGMVVPGLYAAGEVAGMAGGHINGRAGLEGTMFGPCLFSGRVAGRAIATKSPLPITMGEAR